MSSRRFLRTGCQPAGSALSRRSGLQEKDHFCQDCMRPRARPGTWRIPGLPRYTFTAMPGRADRWTPAGPGAGVILLAAAGGVARHALAAATPPREPPGPGHLGISRKTASFSSFPASSGCLCVGR